MTAAAAAGKKGGGASATLGGKGAKTLLAPQPPPPPPIGPPPLKRKIIFGSTATPIALPHHYHPGGGSGEGGLVQPSESGPLDPSHTHRWSVYVKGFYPKEDISTFVKRVVFKLHDSFDEPTRVIDTPPFVVTESGWGEFEIMIKIYFVDGSSSSIHGTVDTLPPVTLFHMLALYPLVPLGAPSPTLPSPSSTLPPLKPVISEQYEEVFFHDPPAPLLDALMAHPQLPSASSTASATTATSRSKGARSSRAPSPSHPSPSALTHRFTKAFEAAELEKLTKVLERVTADYEAQKRLLAQKQEELANVLAEISTLEG